MDNEFPPTKNRMINSEKFPEIMKSQNKIIDKKETEIIIVKTNENESISKEYADVLKNYHIVDNYH